MHAPILSSDARPSLALRRRVAVLGSTGSIGTSGLDVIDHLPDRLEVVGLSAQRNGERLKQQIARYRPRWAVLGEGTLTEQDALPAHGTRLYHGSEHLVRLVQEADVDVVLVGIVGAAGLRSSLAALEMGKTVALANKETLVMAGPIVMELARNKGANLIPVDSEHSAIFQILHPGQQCEVERIVLTASGGPFRNQPRAALEQATVAEALRHPTWKMGPKITVDSATLMNKALEIIEAHWLFGLAPEQIEVLIHPESVIHSFVEFRDGAVLAQLSPPDMRLPIQYALTYPERLCGPTQRLDWRRLEKWHFQQPDRDAFPALDLGYDVARRGGTSGAALNAANEVAVHRFLNGTLRFLDIVPAVRHAVEHHPFQPQPTLEALFRVDAWARQETERWPNLK